MTDVFETLFRVGGAEALLNTLRSAQKETQKLTAEQKKQEKAAKDTFSFGKEFRNQIRDMVAGFLTVQTVLAAIDTIARGAEASIKEFITAEREAFAARATFRGVEGLSDRMTELAEAQSRVTGVDDEFILSQTRMLYSLGATEQQIRRLVPLILDLAAARPEVGLGGASSAVISALTGRAAALNRLGVEYKSTGNRARDFLAIEKAINREFGGTAAAFRQNPAGRADALSAQLENFRANIGERLLLRAQPGIEFGIRALENPNVVNAIIAGVSSALPAPFNTFLLQALRPVSEEERKRAQAEEARLLAQGRGGDPQTRLLAEIANNTRQTRDAIGRQTLSTGGTLAPGTVNARDLQAAIRTAR